MCDVSPVNMVIFNIKCQPIHNTNIIPVVANISPTLIILYSETRPLANCFHYLPYSCTSNTAVKETVSLS